MNQLGNGNKFCFEKMSKDDYLLAAGFSSTIIIMKFHGQALDLARIIGLWGSELSLEVSFHLGKCHVFLALSSFSVLCH